MIQGTTNQQQVGVGISLPKRKAAYVTIEQLVKSQYNIDMQRLNDELRTLKVHDTEVATAAAAIQAAAEGTVSRSEETKENKEPPLRSSSSQSSFSLLKYQNQSRLQPPRDGFNLCV